MFFCVKNLHLVLTDGDLPGDHGHLPAAAAAGVSPLPRPGAAAPLHWRGARQLRHLGQAEAPRAPGTQAQGEVPASQISREWVAKLQTNLGDVRMLLLLSHKNLLAAFNQAKALVGAFSVIIQLQTSLRFIWSSSELSTEMTSRTANTKLFIYRYL